MARMQRRHPSDFRGEIVGLVSVHGEGDSHLLYRWEWIPWFRENAMQPPRLGLEPHLQGDARGPRDGGMGVHIVHPLQRFSLET